MGVDAETKQVFSDRLSGFTANPLACTVRICAVDCVETNTFSALEPPDTEYDRYREFLGTEQYPSVEIQTDANGLFETQLEVPLEFVNAQKETIRPSFKLIAYTTDDVEVFDIQMYEMISPQGISIVSDVDDTIKHSDVYKGLYSTLKKALFHDLQDVPGMADSYNLLVM
jgi:type III secretory pathway component EscV